MLTTNGKSDNQSKADMSTVVGQLVFHFYPFLFGSCFITLRSVGFMDNILEAIWVEFLVKVSYFFYVVRLFV